MKIHKSLIEELVARKSHASPCVEADKVHLYNLLVQALQDGPLESALQAHEDLKDGMEVIKTIMVQLGGKHK